MNKPRILLLSAYDASSHRYWHELLTEQLTDFDWTVLTLPDRHFYWRIRSNALTFTLQHRQTLLSGFDLMLATSMVDLCGLRGLLPGVSRIPTLLYFHENQFAYPVRKPSSNIINSQLVSIYSSLSADRVLFNSSYNRRSFLTGARELFQKMPDGVPGDVMIDVEHSSLVLPVPISTPVAGSAATIDHRASSDRLEIVWNHRWEYDKQPEVFFAAMHLLQDHSVDFVLHIMGQSFRQEPACFSTAKDTFGDRIETWGFQPRDVYLQKLQQADLVVSSAAHDFQGLGMLEAMSQGCVPIAPARVAYEEYIPADLLYHCEAGASNEPVVLFEKLISLFGGDRPEVPDVSRFQAVTLLEQYRLLLAETISAARP